MKNITSLIIALLFPLFLAAQPKTEIRAVWLTTNYALDWPGTDKNATTQKRNLQNILDKLQAININTIIFQVQCRSDVFWESQYQPWSRHITGTANKKPDYDVLQFVIDECHARNMEVHAWVVPYPLGSTSVASLIGSAHTSVKYPNLCLLHSGEWYLDPGLPETTTFLINLYSELVEKYDFDGINLDYTRYSGSDFPDDSSYSKYGGGMTKANWRRKNINTFVHALYDMVQQKKPGMKLGAAPIGAYESLPNASSGFTAYTHLYQDPVEWMSAGKLDLAAPQVYWTAGYEPHLTNWIKKSNGRPIIAGLAAYKMLASESDWAASVITGQITTARNVNADGICFFRSDQITSNLKGLYDNLKANQFKYPANIPPMDWYGVTKPNVPQNVNISNKAGNTYTISWDTPALNGGTAIRYYSVYMGSSADIDIRDVKNLAAHYVKGNSVDYTLPDPTKNYFFTVTAFDKGYYESNISEVVSTQGTSTWNSVPKPEVLLTLNNNELTINADISIKTVQIYAVNGMLQNSISCNQHHLTMDINSIGQGVYIVVAGLEDGSVVKQKIVKL